MGRVSGIIGHALAGAVLVTASLQPACKFHDGQPLAGGDARIIDAPGDGSSLLPDGPGPDTGGSPDASQDAALSCPLAYNLTNNSFPGSHYRSVTASTDWAAAEADCADDGGVTFTPGHLIVLDNDAERAYAFSINNSDQWMGASDINTEGTYQAVTDQANPFFATPSSNAQNKDCMALNNSGTFMDSCTGGHPYVCECDGRVENPNNF